MPLAAASVSRVAPGCTHREGVTDIWNAVHAFSDLIEDTYEPLLPMPLVTRGEPIGGVERAPRGRTINPPSISRCAEAQLTKRFLEGKTQKSDRRSKTSRL
jgi:hypothetical protein